MSWWEGLATALAPVAGMAGGMALAGPLGPAGLLAGGLAGQGIGTALTAYGTRSRMLGPTDQDIANSDALARRSQSAQIRQGAQRQQQMLASQAAQGGTLGSGLYARGAGNIGGAEQQAYGQMEAGLAQNRLAALSQRRYVPELTPMGILGRTLATTTMPLTYLGASGMLQQMQPPAMAQGPARSFTSTQGWQPLAGNTSPLGVASQSYIPGQFGTAPDIYTGALPPMPGYGPGQYGW